MLLTFTMPKKSVRGESLKEVPTLEILRGSLKADGTPEPKSFRVVDTVPGSLIGNYTQQGEVEFHDPVSPGEIKEHAGETVVYRVRTRVSDKRPPRIRRMSPSGCMPCRRGSSLLTRI